MSETVINIKTLSSSEQIIETAKEVLEIETESIKNLIDRLDDSFINAVEILYKCRGRVIITGMGKSGLIGKRLQPPFPAQELLRIFCILLKVLMVIQEF